MNISGFPSLQKLRCQNSSQSSIVIANTQPVIELNGASNTLPYSDVDAILIALDGNGLLAGTVNLSGQTPIAPPTATGLAAAANLIGKGWTVTVDKPTWAPATEIGTWADSGGPAFGNLAAFQAGADMATVTQLTFAGTGNLTSLTGLQGLPVLATLDVNTNSLTALDVSGLTSLATLNCSNNASLTTLMVTGCTGLVTLDCHLCALTSLDLSTCSSIFTVECYENSLTSIDLTNCSTLDNIDCLVNSLTSIDLSDCINLTDIDCSYNLLTGLDTSANPLLKYLFTVGNTGMGSLDVSTNTALLELDCSSNGLASLDVTNNTSLTLLNLTNNSLTTLDVSLNTALTALTCDQNSLTSLDVTSNPLLFFLSCPSQYSLGSPVLIDLRIGNSSLYNYVDASDNALPSSPVGPAQGINDILNLLATNCLNNAGNCNLSGGTNAAPDAGPPDGTAAKAALLAAIPPWNPVNTN